MNKRMPNLDKYFEAARKEPPVLEKSEVKDLINSGSTSSVGNNHMSKFSGSKKMQIITAITTGAVAIGLLVTNPFKSEKEITEIPVKYGKTAAVTDAPEHSQPTSVSVAEKTGRQQIEEKNQSLKKTKKIKIISTEEKRIVKNDFKPIDVKGVNILELSAEDLKNLGFDILDDGSIEYVLSQSPELSTVITVSKDDFRISSIENSNNDGQNAITPRFISDKSGNKKLSLLTSKDMSGIATWCQKIKLDDQDSINGANSIDNFSNLKNIKNLDLQNIPTDPEKLKEFVENLKAKGANVKVMTNGKCSEGKSQKIKIMVSDSCKSDPNSGKSMIMIKMTDEDLQKQMDTGDHQMHVVVKKEVVVDKTDQDSDITVDIEGDNIDEDHVFRINLNTDFEINKMVAVGIRIDRNRPSSKTDYDYIFWFEPTAEFLDKLPENIKNSIDSELLTLAEADDVCEAKAVAGEKTYMDVWRACSGAVEHLDVYPNPSPGNIGMNYQLKEDRMISIAVHDLYGNMVAELQPEMAVAAGNYELKYNISNLDAGMYLIVLSTDKGEQAVQRVILEK